MAFICKSCNSKRGYYSGYILENMYFEKCIVLVAKMHPFFFVNVVIVKQVIIVVIILRTCIVPVAKV